jgi:hypothetical protein
MEVEILQDAIESCHMASAHSRVISCPLERRRQDNVSKCLSKKFLGNRNVEDYVIGNSIALLIKQFQLWAINI